MPNINLTTRFSYTPDHYGGLNLYDHHTRALRYFQPGDDSTPIRDLIDAGLSDDLLDHCLDEYVACLEGA